MTPVDLHGMVNLYVTADFFLIDTLKRWLIPQIKSLVNEDTFWTSLSILLEANQIDAANEIFQPVICQTKLY
jgi:hypothetical protein